jgi:biotin carboxyl carrier protein
VRLFLDGKAVMAQGAEHAAPRSVLLDDENHIVVFEQGEAFAFGLHPPSADATEGGAGDGDIRSPMPGKVTQVSVKTGQAVKKGDPLLTLEAMKMEHALTAPFDGKVEALAAKVGDQVTEGTTLAKLSAA